MTIPFWLSRSTRISTVTWGHSNSVTRQWIACGSSSRILRASCSRTSSAIHIASGTSETSSSGKRNGDSGIASATNATSASTPSPVLAETAKYSTRAATSARPCSAAISSTRPETLSSWAATLGRDVRSTLLTTTTGRVAPDRAFSSTVAMVVASPGPIGDAASTTAITTSTSPAAPRAVSLSRPPIVVRGRCSPGVSTKITWTSPSVRTPRTAWRVVFGLGAVIVTLAPTIWLTRVDLPTFGRPSTAAKPQRVTTRPPAARRGPPRCVGPPRASR